MAGPRQWASAALKSVGLLGGSFNPAHGGHRSISLFALEALGLDEIWWLVSPGNPLKAQDGMASLPARLASARALSRRSRIKATAIEAQLGTKYTVESLRKLKLRYPKTRFVWIMGADNLAQFVKWRRWRDIARMMPIAVIARPGYDDQCYYGSRHGLVQAICPPLGPTETLDDMENASACLFALSSRFSLSNGHSPC